MKYNIKEEKERIYFGVSEIVEMENISEFSFPGTWDKTMEIYDRKNYTELYSAIGLESYPENFMEEKKFAYSALMPVRSVEGLDEKYLIVVEEGRYIRFETTFKAVTQEGYTKEVYKYIQEHNIPVDFSFDYEEYPPAFDASDPNSVIFICFRYLGE